MKACIKTLGCKVNTYESEYIRYLLKNNNYEIVDDLADIYIINTCTVTNNSDTKSKKLIRSIRRNNKDSIVIAIGCFCQYKKHNILDYIDADIILGNSKKSKIIELLNEYLNNKKRIVLFDDVSTIDFEDMEINEFESKTRAFVKIEDGCNNFCSYCIIPYVRGRIRSKSSIKVIDEIKSLCISGHKEIVLTGIHTGAYYDKEYDIDFSGLLKLILSIKGLKRLRISSIEVTELNSEFINILKNNKILVSHMHIPLQNGSDEILKKMNRKYNTLYFLNKINEIRSVRPNISITTDLIVGFPGETEELFNESYLFCKKIGFSKIHVFPYSDRDGTKASIMNDKIDGLTKKERVKRMMELSSIMEKEYSYSFIGKKESVLFEEYKDNYFIGHTGNYIKVKVKGNYTLHQIYDIKLEKDNIVLN